MTWQDIKRRAALTFDGIVAEIPEGDDGDTIDRKLQRVFIAPPDSIEPGELPCIVFGESTLEDGWEPSAVGEDYLLTCSLLLRDEDHARAVEWAESWREVVKHRLRKNIKLGLAGVVLNGASYTAVQQIVFGGLAFEGFQFTFPINNVEPYDFEVGDGDEE